MTAAKPTRRATGDDDVAWGRSQADEALRRLIATPASKSPKLPVDPAARRRAIQLLGW